MRRVSLIAVTFALLVASAQVTAHAASTVWPSSNGQIVFRSDRDGKPELFTVPASGGAATKLTRAGNVAELRPAYSPEGGLLAYVRRPHVTGRSDLFLMTAAGTGRTRITSTGVAEQDPSWASNGTRVVFAARTHARGPFRIFIVEPDGTGRVQLTSQASGSADRSPVFSPDGSRIAYVSDRDGGFPELYVMNADGSGKERLTTNSSIDGNPSWTPDGTKLVFERCCKDGTSDLFMIDVVTRAETNLTASTGQQEFDPVVSPDGSMVAFVAFEVGVGNIDIWLMNLDGSNRIRLTQHAAPDLSPDWQPNPICTIPGSDGPDEIVGTDGNDVICALDGSDTVNAGAGDDLVLGERGNDTLRGEDGSDLLLGERGADLLDGGREFDVLDGGGGTDTCLKGGSGAYLRLCEL